MTRPTGLWPFTEMVLDQIDQLGSTVLKIEAHAHSEPEEPDFIWGLLTPEAELSDGEYMQIDHEAGRYSAAFGMRGCSGGDPSWGDEEHRFIQPSPENAALVAKSYCDYFSKRIKP